MRNHDFYVPKDYQKEENLEEDHSAVAEDGITLCVKKTNSQARNITSYWNQDHVVR